MTISNCLIQACIDEALKSDFCYKIGAVIFNQKGAIISRAYNVANGYRRKIHKKFLKWQNSLHAEVLAIFNARCDLNKYYMLVVRVNNKKELRLAKPCNNCQQYIEYVNLKGVFYSDNDGKIKELY